MRFSNPVIAKRVILQSLFFLIATESWICIYVYKLFNPLGREFFLITFSFFFSLASSPITGDN